jgi:hypothetical protein
MKSLIPIPSAKDVTTFVIVAIATAIVLVALFVWFGSGMTIAP